MKKHYDFSKARKGVMHRPASSLRIPVYLDDDVQRQLSTRTGGEDGLSSIVNKLLRAQIRAAKLLQS